MAKVIYAIEQRGPLLWFGVAFAVAGLSASLPTVWGGSWVWLFAGGVVTIVGFSVVRASTRPLHLVLVGDELVVRFRGRPSERSIARAQVGGIEIKMGGRLDSTLTDQKYVVRTAPPLEGSRGLTMEVHGFGNRSEAMACAQAIGSVLDVPVSTHERG